MIQNIGSKVKLQRLLGTHYTKSNSLLIDVGGHGLP